MEVKNSTNEWSCNGNVFEYEIVCISQYMYMQTLVPLWCHTIKYAEQTLHYCRGISQWKPLKWISKHATTKSIWKANVSLIGMSCVSQVRVGIIGKAMQLVGFASYNYLTVTGTILIILELHSNVYYLYKLSKISAT